MVSIPTHEPEWICSTSLLILSRLTLRWIGGSLRRCYIPLQSSLNAQSWLGGLEIPFHDRAHRGWPIPSPYGPGHARFLCGLPVFCIGQTIVRPEHECA